MSEKIDKLIEDNKTIFLIILLFSFQLSPITSLIFPDSPTLGEVLTDIVQIGLLILGGIKWLSELSPKLIEDLDSMELDREILFKHNVVVILAAVIGIAMVFSSLFLPINKIISSRIAIWLALVILTILAKLKHKYAQGKQSKDDDSILVLTILIVVLGLFIFL